MFDLIGMEVAELRRKAKITILRRHNGWERGQVSKLVNQLKPLCVVSQHPRYSELLMLHGEFSEESIRSVLGALDFEHQIFLGLDNPALPFPVPSP